MAPVQRLVEIIDAITTDRPYQKGRSADEALNSLKRHAGTKWDADCVHALEAVLGLSQEPGGDGSTGTSD